LGEEIKEKERLGQRVANDNLIKSRGLYRKRPKYQGNAKLHNREKFFKKEKVRKNYVKEYTGKPLKYGGELTGIRDDLLRGTKLH
jgi:U3 small nucleolar RNA-associated protein 3